MGKNITISDELHRKLKVEAAQAGDTLQDYVEEKLEGSKLIKKKDDKSIEEIKEGLGDGKQVTSEALEAANRKKRLAE